MNGSDIFKAIGDIDEKMLLECEKMANKKKIAIVVSMAACAAILVAAPLVFSGDKAQWPTKYVYIDSTDEDEIAPVPDWDELSLCQKFSVVEVMGAEYDSRETAVDVALVGDVLSGDGYAQGIQPDDGTLCKENIIVYSIDGISSECAVAVRFLNTEDVGYYVYVNSNYRPETLGQFISDLDLRENIEFGTAYYSYWNSEKDYGTIEFANISGEAIWQMILSDTEAKNVGDYNTMSFPNVLSISVNIPILGYENISVGVTENGYVTTNILNTGKAFFIGVEQTKTFVDYVLENCEGYKVVYVESDIQIPE